MAMGPFKIIEASILIGSLILHEKENQIHFTFQCATYLQEKPFVHP